MKDGFSIVAAKNSDEAILTLQTMPVDLILMDIILPGRSGFEAMELISSNPATSKIPVMIISNLGQETDIARGKQLGVVEYFVKAQTSIDDLVRKIKEFFSGGLSTI